MKIYLTGKKLKDMEACKDARMSFRSIFSKKATIKQVVHRLQNPGKRDKYALRYGGWLGWLMAQTLELTIVFLKAGADVHALGDFALRSAAQDGYTEVVKALLEAGADVHVENDFALLHAELNRHTETVKVFKAAMKKK